MATAEHARTEESIRRLSDVADLAFRVAQMEGSARKPDEQHLKDELIKIHFWKIAAHLYSIRRIVARCCGARVLWDVSGVAALARSIIDAALGLSYWSDNSEPEETTLKYALYKMHESAREAQWLELIGSDEKTAIAQHNEIIDDVRKHIFSSPLFQGRLADRRKRALNTDLPRLHSNTVIAERAGLSVDSQKAMWDLLSNFAHGYPHATEWLRTFSAADERSASLLGLFVRIASMYASWAVLQFAQHFPVVALTDAEREDLTIHAGLLFVNLKDLKTSD